MREAKMSAERMTGAVAGVSRSKWNALVIFLVLDLIQILTVSLMYLDESTVLVVGFDLSRHNPFLSASLFFMVVGFQVLMIYLLAFRVRASKDLVRLYPTLSMNVSSGCKFAAEEIVRWTLEIAERSGQKVREVYLMRSPLPNAFTFSLPLLGTVVVLHSNLLDLLSPEEVRAIIAHEVGHVKNRDSMVSILTRMPSVFVDAIYFYIYVRLLLASVVALLVNLNPALALVRAGMLFGFFILSRAMVFLGHLVVTRASRAAELLSDYHAAELLGFETTINALTVLGQRVEAVTALIEEVRWLESLNPARTQPISGTELGQMIQSYPLDGIDEDNARQAAPRLFLRNKLAALRDVYGVSISDEEVERMIRPAIDRLITKRSKDSASLRDTREKKTIDWRSADSNSDQRLTGQELTDLVRLLRENPGKLLFDNEISQNLLAMDHPDFRSRVLFLADVYGV
ncbi:MAG: M48 family metalloprotease [Candidatus Thorarchaeota archaeon]|nr:M48 family metalloprotease [Candidatus Thorarchaeota archaeon]